MHLCQSEFHHELYKLTDEIVSKYFNIFGCLTYITDQNLQTHIQKTQQPAIRIDLRTLNKSSLLAESYFQGCTGFVVQVGSTRRSAIVKDMIKAYKDSIRNRYNYHRYLFLTTNEEDKDIGIIDGPDMFFMPNFIFVASNDHLGRNFSVFTHNVFHGHKYDVLMIKHENIANWSSSSGFSAQVDLYHDKIQNLNGKKLMFSMIQYPPYSMIIPESNKTIYDGLETRLAAKFAEVSNGTWDGQDHAEDLWGTVFDNGTGSGILGAVLG